MYGIDGAAIAERRARFVDDLSTDLTEEQIVRRHILYGLPAVLDALTYRELKHDLAEALGADVHSTQTVMVGSAKLGFSIKPAEDRFMRDFSETSDIDMAVVSDRLFTRLWEEGFDLIEDEYQWAAKKGFQNNVFRGRVGPGFLPLDAGVPECSSWSELLRELNESGRYGPYLITGAVFHSWHFLERYQCRQVLHCRNLVKLGEL